MPAAALALAVFVGGPLAALYVQLRSWPLAAMAWLAPLGALACCLLAPGAQVVALLAAALFAMTCAFALGDGFVRGVCAGIEPRAAVPRAALDTAAAAVPVVAAYGLSFVADGIATGGLGAWSLAPAAFLLAAAAVWAAVWLSTLFPYTEEFVARANLARERRERAFSHLAFATETRWALSICGIAMVLATVAAFGLRGSQPVWTGHDAVPLAVFGAGLCAAFVFVARDWRVGLSAAMAVAFAGLLLLWGMSRLQGGQFLRGTELAGWLAAAALPPAVLVHRLREALRQGDALAPALGRALRRDGFAAVAFGGIIAAVSVPLLRYFVPWSAFAAASVFAALLLFPALTVAIYTFLPRYRSVDEVFGKR